MVISRFSEFVRTYSTLSHALNHLLGIFKMIFRIFVFLISQIFNFILSSRSRALELSKIQIYATGRFQVALALNAS